MKKLFVFVLVLLMLVGLGMVIYPVISNLVNEDQSIVQAQYSDVVETMTDEEIKSVKQAAKLYNEALMSIQGTEVVQVQPYEDLLNLSGNGVMCSLEIPAIQVELPVYHGVDEEVLQKGAGHMPGTSLPIGGEGTHAVISAHAGLATARLFTDLEKLVEGDVFYIHVLDETLCYEVDQILVTLPSDTETVRIEEGEDYVTLLTCTPYGVNTHRLLVRGHRIEMLETIMETNVEETEAPERTSIWTEKYLQGIAIGMVATVLLVGLLTTIVKIRKKRN